MLKNPKSIIEEQREIAERLLKNYVYIPSPPREDGSQPTDMQTDIVLDYMMHFDQWHRLERLKAQSIPELASAIRELVERDVVDSVFVSRGDFVFSIVFAMLHDVDWELIAEEVGERIHRNAEGIEEARKSGMLAIMESMLEDKMPKN